MRAATRDLLAQFGRRLREARQGAGLPRSEVARRCDIHVNTLFNIETGRADTTLGIAATLARVLEVPLASLLPGAKLSRSAPPSSLRARQLLLGHLAEGLNRRSLEQLIAQARMLRDLDDYSATRSKKRPGRRRR